MHFTGIDPAMWRAAAAHGAQAQVDRGRGVDIELLLEEWADDSPLIEEALDAAGIRRSIEARISTLTPLLKKSA